MKTLNILTRTSGRPNFFRVCKQSIRQQDYPNIKHWVIVDDKNDNSYVNEYPDIEIINVSQKDHNHFETYLNEGLSRIPKGELFCVMDDDDFYVRDNSLSRAVGVLGEGDVVFFQVQCAGGLVPTPSLVTGSNKRLEGGQISMEGFVMTVDFTWNPVTGKRIQFPGVYGGDWAFIDACIGYNYGPDGTLKDDFRDWNNEKIKWCIEKLASTNPCRRQGSGESMDMDYNTILQGYQRSK